MEKVKVSREVADAIEFVKSVHGIERTIELHSDGKWKGKSWDALNELSLLQIATALIVGYEVELTPEDIILNKVNELRKKLEKYRSIEARAICQGKLAGITFVLETLDIKIEGVNTDDLHA